MEPQSAAKRSETSDFDVTVPYCAPFASSSRPTQHPNPNSPTLLAPTLSFSSTVSLTFFAFSGHPVPEGSRNVVPHPRFPLSGIPRVPLRSTAFRPLVNY